MLELYELAKQFNEAGFPLYGVGSIVRNPLLGLPISDIDVTSAMPPETVIKLCERLGFSYALKGVKFGTVEIHIKADGKAPIFAEHTTFRSDTYGAGGEHHPQNVRFSESITEDAFRRDFTVNAIYKNLLTDELIDPTNGLDDIKKRVMRTTSQNPKTILCNDGLRIMRLVRFASELDFRIEQSTFNAARANIGVLSDISPERIRDELNKILLSDVRYNMEHAISPVLRGLRLLRALHAFDCFMPEIEEGREHRQRSDFHAYTVMEHLFHTAECIKPELTLRLAALLHDIGKPRAFAANNGKNMKGHDKTGAQMADAVLTRLRYPNSIREEVVFLIENHMYDIKNEAKEQTLRQRIVQWGYDNTMKLACLRSADMIGSGMPGKNKDSAQRFIDTANKLKDEGAPFSEGELKCTGSDIALWRGLEPSPEIGRLKHYLLLHCAVCPEDNTREALKKLCMDYRFDNQRQTSQSADDKIY